MKYTDLKNDIKNGAKGIYLFAGDDAYFKMKGEQMLKEAFVQMPELNFSSFAGENLKGANLSSLITAVESYPFMSEKRMVKVTDLYVSDKEYETYLKKTFENFPSASLLLIVNSDSKKSDNLKRKPCITYVDCNRADEETVTKWIYLNLKRRGINAGADVCANIAKYCLCNMSRVALETEKIVDYKVEGTLTQSEADELVYKDAEYRIYEMTNAVARKD